jgi:hypothetical protein
MADIAIAVAVCARAGRRIEPDLMHPDHIGHPRWVDAQDQEHRRRLGALIGDVKAGTDLHEFLSPAEK